MTCKSCEFCDTSESEIDSPGYCTKLDNFFCGQRVPVWLRGCPDFEIATVVVALPQGDGDMGDAA